MNATKKSIKGCCTFDDILNVQYGSEGTPERDQFECDAEIFILAERLKEERLKAGLTQEQLAQKIGTKKSYISRIENGKTDVQLSTLYKIFQGLGKRVRLTIL
ncbi:MAG: helix-turn-helix transcriptional regulator [Odoribacter sp.]